MQTRAYLERAAKHSPIIHFPKPPVTGLQKVKRYDDDVQALLQALARLQEFRRPC